MQSQGLCYLALCSDLCGNTTKVVDANIATEHGTATSPGATPVQCDPVSAVEVSTDVPPSGVQNVGQRACH